MSNEQITFSCTSCAVELKVPFTFAGVTGPCPGCQTPITAPDPAQNKKAAPSVPSVPSPSPRATAPVATSSPPRPAAVPSAGIPSLSGERAPKPDLSSPAKAETAEPEAAKPKPAPRVPNISVPSKPKREETAKPVSAFPSAPIPASKGVLPPRRGEIEPHTPLVSSTDRTSPSSQFPSSLIPNAKTAPAERSQNLAPPSPPADAIPAPATTRNVSSPNTPSPQDIPAPTPLPVSPSAPATPSVPQPEPKSGSASYPISQPPSGISAVPQPLHSSAEGIPAPIHPSSPPLPVSQPPIAAPPKSPAPSPAATVSAPVSPSAHSAQPTPAPVISGGLSTFAPAPQQEAPSSKNDRPKKSKLRWLWFAVPVLFLLLCGAIVYIVTDLLNNHTAGNANENGDLHVLTAPNQSARQLAKQKMALLHPASPKSAFSQIPDRLDPVSADLDQGDLFVEGEAPPSPLLQKNTTPEEPISFEFNPDVPAEILEDFLNATTFEERKKFLSPSTRSDAELSASSLAKPLPEVLHRRLLHYMVNEAERHTEHFFEVSFQKIPGERPYPILIQINDWGDGNCQVHTDAFLDLFDDALSQFSTKPVAGTKTFHVTADAYKHCFDEIIPDWDHKSFLKLRNHPRMSPRLIAYFNRKSPLADKISSPGALPWGESGICTVSVSWNTTDPERPFVELLDVIGFTWEP